MKPELPQKENAAVQQDSCKTSDYQPPRIESVITAEQMERENLYAGLGLLGQVSMTDN